MVSASVPPFFKVNNSLLSNRVALPEEALQFLPVEVLVTGWINIQEAKRLSHAFA